MYLIIKGKAPQPICCVCVALHAAKDCPKRIEANRHAREFFREAVALQREMEEKRRAV